MVETHFGQNSSSRRPFYKTYLQKIWFTKLFYSSLLFREGGGYGAESYWPATKFFCYGQKYIPIFVCKS